MALPAPASLTHQHLAAAITSEHSHRTTGSTVRVLDAGCGDGRLLAFLQAVLPMLAGHLNWEFYGFDVIDSTSNRDTFPATTVSSLQEQRPSLDWSDRIRACSTRHPWPFNDEEFDIVVSNQVFEHVQYLEPFLAQLRRVLVPGGRSYHLFPLRTCLFEGHVFLPIAAQVTGNEQRRAWVRLLNRRGLGRADHLAEGASGSRRAADYVHLSTHYRSWRHFVIASKPHGLLPSYRYTLEFYAQKFRQLTGRPLMTSYRTERRALLDAAAFTSLRYVSSISLVLERPPTADR